MSASAEGLREGRSVFGSKNEHDQDAPIKPGEAPFDELQRGYRDDVSRYRKQLASSMLVNVVLGLALTGAAAAIVYLAAFRLPPTYVLEVDGDNNVRFAGEISAQQVLGDEYLPSQIMSFIENWRTVTPDNTMQKRNISRLYCMVPRQALTFAKMNDYFRDPSNDPFERNRDLSVSTRIRQISKLSGSTWQAEWYETTREHDGKIVQNRVPMKATMIIDRNKVGSECMEGNTLGMFVMDINWTNVR